MKNFKGWLVAALVGIMCVGSVVSVSAANSAEFDAAWYAERNPDVVAAFGNSAEAMRAHYNKYGKSEGRMANTNDVWAQLRQLFDAEEYAALYPDVVQVFGFNVEAMFDHYLAYGILEARRPSYDVSQATAFSLKSTIEKAMTDSGLSAAPGNRQLVSVIEGNIRGNTQVRAALGQVQGTVQTAIKNTAAAVQAPPAAPSDSSSSSSSHRGGGGRPSTDGEGGGRPSTDGEGGGGSTTEKPPEEDKTNPGENDTNPGENDTNPGENEQTPNTPATPDTPTTPSEGDSETTTESNEQPEPSTELENNTTLTE